uniref:Tissue factor pathway inhibitor n=1 Tax=Tetraodon nigroviridis TaxID=99883 RepID=H3BWP7_TETNG
IFNELCALKDEQGPCKAIKDRFFFNVDNGRCEQFEYGGCGGNANNFETLEECEETCVVSVLCSLLEISLQKNNKTPCHLSEAPGPCRGLLSRYFYDSRSQQCKHFFYGGCFGNANNFRSMAECQAKCQSPGRSGCLDVALMTLKASNRNLIEKPTEEPVLSDKHNPQSELTSFVNPGSAANNDSEIKYNSVTKRCQAFYYSGCGGNENNFARRRSCIAKCIKGQREFFFRGILETHAKEREKVLKASVQFIVYINI